MKRVLQVLGSLQRGGAETLVMNIYRNIDRKRYNLISLLERMLKMVMKKK